MSASGERLWPEGFQQRPHQKPTSCLFPTQSVTFGSIPTLEAPKNPHTAARTFAASNSVGSKEFQRPGCDLSVPLRSRVLCGAISSLACPPRVASSPPRQLYTTSTSRHIDTARTIVDQFAKPPATAVFSQPRRCAGMTPKLKPLLLPPLVEQRFGLRAEQQQVKGPPAMATPDYGDQSFVYYTTNSSASDITSPVTPIFSPKGHQRCSSSTSSLELPMQLPQECPTSPSQASSTMSSLRQLPDVEEEPLDRGEDTTTLSGHHFGLYSCLCMCRHCILVVLAT